jgi:hypothetical protein
LFSLHLIKKWTSSSISFSEHFWHILSSLCTFLYLPVSICNLCDDNIRSLHIFFNSFDNLNYRIVNHAESTIFSDLWLYWVTGVLTGTIPWFSLLDGHPTKWTTH